VRLVESCWQGQGKATNTRALDQLARLVRRVRPSLAIKSSILGVSDARLHPQLLAASSRFRGLLLVFLSPSAALILPVEQGKYAKSTLNFCVLQCLRQYIVANASLGYIMLICLRSGTTVSLTG